MSDLEEDDLAAIEAELAALGGEDDEDLEDLEEDLDDEELARLEAEVAEMENEVGEVDVSDEEDDQDFEESGNTFIGALQRPRYASLMTNLEEEMKRELELAKTRPRDCVPKYLVNPFALPNRLDYEEIFDEIDPEEPDLKVWKLDNFEPVPIALKEYGKFYSGDCYVILYITEAHQGGIVINIHHWIGDQASPDKFGAAAFRAVELNMFMGGRCHIYRELESRESQLFVDYFEGRLEYLVGGTAEGFNHVVSNSPKEHKPCLYQLIPQSSGQLVMKRTELGVASLDSEFIYLLDAGKRIFQWNGQFVSTKYRHRATAHAYTIRSNERAGLADIIVLTEGEPDELLAYEEDIFWQYLKGRKAPQPPNAVPPPRTVTKRFVFEQEDAEDLEEAILAVSLRGSWDNFYEALPMVKGEDGFELELPLKDGSYTYQYRVATASGIHSYCDMVRDVTHNHLGEVNVVNAVVGQDQDYSLWGTSSNSSGKISLSEIDFEGKLRRDLLRTENAFILDCTTEVFVWVGRACKPLEKQVALAVAKKVYAKYDRHEWAPILGVYESAELTTFTSKFMTWDHLKPYQSPSQKKAVKRPKKSVRFSLPSIVNVEGLLRDSKESTETMIDNGSGTVEVRLFTLKDGASQAAIPPNTTGVFFTESSYIVLYKYDVEVRGKKVKKFLVYFWSGLGCKNSNNAYAKFVLDFQQMLLSRVGPERLSAVRVREGKEPKHFMRLFNGRIVVKRGSQGIYSRHLSENTLYHVAISSHLVGYPRTHIVEVDPVVSSLVSARCFLLFTSQETFLWVGESSYPEEQDIAAGLCHFISNTNYHTSPDAEPVLVKQTDTSSSASQTFFKHLPGSIKDICTLPSCTGRMFNVSVRLGYFEVSEISNYAQYDLLMYKSDVLLLHTSSVLYLWYSSRALPSLLVRAREVAREWTKQVTEARGEDQLISEQTQGKEENQFKALFAGWQLNYLRSSHYEAPTFKREERAKALHRESIRLNDLQKEIDELQDQIELLELISSSAKYSRAEENATNPKFNRIHVSFDEELIQLGLKESPPAPVVNKMQVFKDGVQPGEVLFFWPAPALAVMVKGSWNDWQPVPLVSYGAHGFATKVSLPPGRYYLKYVVASNDGAHSETEENKPVTSIEIDGEQESVNILRVYLRIHPTYLAEQKKLREDEEEAKRKQEEEANRTLTPEEFEKKQKEWKEQQRIANEERLRRQLEEKRRNRLFSTIATASSIEESKEDSPATVESALEERIASRVARRTRTSILDESETSLRGKRAPAKESSPRKEEKASSNLTYSKTLLSNLSSNRRATSTSTSRVYSPSQEIATSFTDERTDSYRERRRAELGLGTSSARANSPAKEPEPVRETARPDRTSSLLDRLDEKIVSSSRTTRSSDSRPSATQASPDESSSAPSRPSRVPREVTKEEPELSSTRTPSSRTRIPETASPTPTPPRESSPAASPTRVSRVTAASAPETPSGAAPEDERERKRRERRRALGLE